MFKLIKEKPMDCGIIFQDEYNNILIMKSRENNYYQIPKGVMKEREHRSSYWKAAREESFNKAGINIRNLKLIDLEVLGFYNYKKNKDLFLFRITVKKLPNIKELKNLKINDYKIINVYDHPRWLDYDLVKVFDKIYKGRHKPGEPCSHPGCCSHITHPCENCGRIGCR